MDPPDEGRELSRFERINIEAGVGRTLHRRAPAVISQLPTRRQSGPRYIRMSVAAEILQVSRPRVHQLARQLDWDLLRGPSYTMVLLSDVLNWVPGEPGRPRKCEG